MVQFLGSTSDRRPSVQIDLPVVGVIGVEKNSVPFSSPSPLGARKVPAPSTEGDFLRRFDSDSIWDLMEAINEARLKVWSCQDQEFHRRATIDVDGTIAPTGGECTSGIAMSYNGQWSYHPLVVSLAQTNEVFVRTQPALP